MKRRSLVTCKPRPAGSTRLELVASRLPDQADTLHRESLATVLRAPDMREKLSVEAIEPTFMTPEKFGDFIRADIARWTKLAQDRGIQLDS